SLKGLAGMLGFGEISELSHNLEDMLDRLRMGKIEITRDLIDLLYDAVDSLNRLVIAINDPSLGGLVDINALTRRIHQLVTAQPQQQQGDAFRDLTLDEQTRKSLTEYEEHRLLAHELTKTSRNLDRKLNELQKSVIETRMVPVGQIYSKLSRTVRKVTRELNKEIELVLRGEDTELDKMMVEELTDPLMHIIRNALDHGIEPADQRRAAGKSPPGRVTLNAYQQGHSVVIDVTDDGRGINPEKIRRVAVERGLIGEKD